MRGSHKHHRRALLQPSAQTRAWKVQGKPFRKRRPWTTRKPILGEAARHGLELAVGKHVEPPRARYRHKPPLKFLLQCGAAQPDLIRLLADLDVGNLPQMADGRQIGLAEADRPGTR